MPILHDQIQGTPSSVAFKIACRVATVAQAMLAGIQTIDGESLDDGDRVLVTAQDDSTENGIWIVNSSAWQRATDADGNRDFVCGTFVNVYSGVAQSGFYEVTTSDPIVIGTSAIGFRRWILIAA